MLEKLKKTLKNKNVKKLIENFFSLASIQVFSLILPLVTLPYVLRVIGFSNYGIVVMAASLVAYFYSVTDYSFRITATRDVALFRESPKKLNLIYSKVIMVKTLLLLISCSILLLVIFLYPPFYEERLIFLLSALMLLGYTIFPEWFFQGMEQMKYITFLNLGVKIFFTICVFIFIKTKQDYWIYPLLNSVGFIASGVVAQYILIKKYKLKFILLKWSMITKTVKDNFPIFVNQFIPNLYNNTATFLLGILTTNHLVGIYDALKKIVDLSAIMISTISRVFFPFLNRNKGSFVKYKKLMIIVGATLAIVPILCYPIVFWYLDITHEHALITFAMLSISIFFLALYDIFGLNYFIIKRQDKLVMKNTIISSVIGFLLAFPLIHFFGIVGAATNLLISRGIMGLGLSYKYIIQKK